MVLGCISPLTSTSSCLENLLAYRERKPSAQPTRLFLKCLFDDSRWSPSSVRA